jgi:hypothetical protein
MMRMINALSWPWVKRISPGHRNTILSDQWIQDGLLQGCRPDIGCERLSVDGDVDPPMSLIGNNLNTLVGSV